MLKNPFGRIKFNLRKKTNKPKGFSLRETRVAQVSIFENYSKHEFGIRLKTLSHLSDSMSYRTFVRLPRHLFPCKQSLNT